MILDINIKQLSSSSIRPRVSGLLKGRTVKLGLTAQGGHYGYLAFVRIQIIILLVGC